MVCTQAAEACFVSVLDAAMSSLNLHVTEHSCPLYAKQVIAPLRPIKTWHLSDICFNMSHGEVPCEQQ